MKKLLFLLLLIPTVAHAGFFDFFHKAEPAIITGDINIRPLDQFTPTTTPTDAITQRIWGRSLKITGLTAGQCLKLDADNLVVSTACGGGAGGGSGTWSTTTSSVSGQLTNYPNNDTDIVTIGSSATTSSEFYFDPNVPLAKIGGQLLVTGSSTLQNYTARNSTSSQATTTNLAISSILSKILKTNGAGSVVEATAGVDYQAAGTYVTAITVASANGFTGSSSGGATPALTLTTSISGVLKGNGTAISAAANGTDYTLITAQSCSANQHVSAITADGSVTCSADFVTQSTDKWSTSTDSRYIQPNSAQGIIVTNSTSTNATSTNLYISGTTRLASLTGLLKATTGVVTTGANGTDYTLITAKTCTGTDKFSAVSADGTFVCSTDSSGAGGSGDSVWSRNQTTNLIYHPTTTDSVAFGVTATSSVPTLLVDNSNLKVGIGTSTAYQKLDVYGGIFSGTEWNTGATLPATIAPINGDSSLFIWYPKTGSIYAGERTSSLTVANIGGASANFGLNNTASGYGTIVSGESNVVSGDNSGAMGKSNSVSVAESFAFGQGNTINTGALFSTIFGKDNIVGNGSQNAEEGFAIGYNNVVEANGGGSLGSNNKVITDHFATAPQYSLTIGDSNIVRTPQGIAIGSGNQTGDDYYGIGNGVAIGLNNRATSSYAYAIGNGVTSGSKNTITIGSGVVNANGLSTSNLINNATGTIAFGSNSTVPTMVISSSTGAGTIGKVGIGTTTPFERLTVGGNTYIDGDLTATGTITFIGKATGCATFTSGVLSSTGVACGSGSGGGGNSKWATTSNSLDITPNGLGGIIVSASSTIDSLSVRNGTTTNATSTIINVGNLTATGSTTLQNYTAKLATTTSATTTNFAFTGLTSSLLAVNPTGQVIASSTIGNAQLQNSSITVTTAGPLGGAGTISLGQTLALTCTGCLTTVDISANTNLAATYPIVLTNDTLSLINGGAFSTTSQDYYNSQFRDWSLQGSPLFLAPTTSRAVLVNNGTSTITNLQTINGTTTNATSTNLSISGTLDIDQMTSALLLTGSTGIVAEYAGSSNPCTNQVPTTISALGALGGCTSINGSWWSGTDLAIADGGTNASSQTTNGVNYFNGTSITSEAAFTYVESTNILTVDSFLANASSTFQNFTGKNATTSNATTTNFFATTASTTNFFGAGLPGIGCVGTSFLQWSAGLFSCGTPASGGGANSKWATSTGDTAAIYTVGLAGISSVGIGTTTPHWSLQVASTTPFIGITDTNAATDKKHGLISYQDGIFVIGTSSDSMTSTSSAVSIDPNKASSLTIGSTTQSVSSVNGLFVQGTNGESGTSTQSTGKWQVDMYNSAGTRSCMFVVGTTLTVIAGACNP